MSHSDSSPRLSPRSKRRGRIVSCDVYPGRRLRCELALGYLSGLRPLERIFRDRTSFTNHARLRLNDNCRLALRPHGSAAAVKEKRLFSNSWFPLLASVRSEFSAFFCG